MMPCLNPICRPQRAAGFSPRGLAHPDQSQYEAVANLRIVAATALAVALILPACSRATLAVAASAPATQAFEDQTRPILTPAARLAADRELVDRFVRHVLTSENVPESARKAVTDAWARHRADEQPRDFLIAAIAMISEPFKRGLEAIEQEDLALAADALRPLLNDKDLWISLQASAAMARILVEQDRFDEAAKQLSRLAARRRDLIEKSFLEAEVDFLVGYCELANLQYDKAKAALERFERLHPDAPDKFRLPARQMLAELEVHEPGSLGEVSDLMVYAGRRLHRGLADQPVRQSQKRAVDLLNQLIEEAEQREKQQQQQNDSPSGGKGGSGRRMGNTPASPARESMLPDGPGAKGELESRPPARPGEMWGQMRPEDRQRILQSLREGFPSRYRQLVEQYYRQLAKEQ